MKLSTTWKHWLKNHKDKDEYHLHYDKILTLLDTDNLSPQGCFSLIKRRLENIVLLTVSTEGSITCSFYHEKWGNPIIDNSMKSICLTGFGEKAFPTLIKTDEVLSSSDNEILVPSWEDFIFLSSILLDLTKHFPNYYLLSFVKALRQAEKNALKDNDLDNIERTKLFHDTFVFLWALENETVSKLVKRSKS